jgi:hypothetical protein
MGVINKSDAAPRRSEQNILRLLYLIDQFHSRDVGYKGAAQMLRCSPARARQYLHELLNNGIIMKCLHMMPQDSPDERGFCLNPEPDVVRRFVAELGAQVESQSSAVRVCVPEHNDSAKSIEREVWRDPLVIALFGPAPGHSA